MAQEKEYRVNVNVCGKLFQHFLIPASSPGEALEKVKKDLRNFTVSIEVEVQADLELVTQVIR